MRKIDRVKKRFVEGGILSLRLLADKVVELGYIDSVSHEAIRGIPKKRNYALTTKRMGNFNGAKRQLLRIWKGCWTFTSVRLIHDILLYA
jgi:hypothetical protein